VVFIVRKLVILIKGPSLNFMKGRF